MGEQAGDLEKKWQDQFGGIVRFKAPLAVGLRNLLALHIFTMASADLPYEQEDCLLVSDPKAIQYVLQTSRYRFVKPYDTRLLLNTATGKGVHGAEGNATTCLLAPHKIMKRANTKGADHHRQRRILLLAFGSHESQALIPVFKDSAQSVRSHFSALCFIFIFLFYVLLACTAASRFLVTEPGPQNH